MISPLLLAPSENRPKWTRPRTFFAAESSAHRRGEGAMGPLRRRARPLEAIDLDAARLTEALLPTVSTEHR
jgi:hypothetical protein